VKAIQKGGGGKGDTGKTLFDQGLYQMANDWGGDTEWGKTVHDKDSWGREVEKDYQAY